MADTKISALTAATTPLAGTEVLPIVQSGSTVKVSAADITAGRAVSAASLALTSSPLPVTSGGTGSSSAFTANGVAYASSTTTIATGSGIQFNPTSGVFSSFITGSNSMLVNFATTTFATRGLRINSYTSANGAVDCGIEFDSGVSGYGGFKFSNSGTPLVTIDDTNSNVKIELGNLVQGTAAKGINFTANTPASGMTSQLLNWYEEGTWTPFISTDNVPPTITYTANSGGRYVRIGNLVHIQGFVETASVNTAGASGFLIFGGFPFNVVANSGGTQNSASSLNIAVANGWAGNTPSAVSFYQNNFGYLVYRATSNGPTANLVLADLTTGSAGNLIIFGGTYITA
jgi:hypothetical protein